VFRLRRFRAKNALAPDDIFSGNNLYTSRYRSRRSFSNPIFIIAF
jgi:hypothetical protein